MVNWLMVVVVVVVVVVVLLFVVVVVTSLHGNKGFGLREALPSTPCCECCSGALPSCTEVFHL